MSDLALGPTWQVGNKLFGSFSEKNFVIKSTDPVLKYYMAGETGGTPAGSLDLRKVRGVFSVTNIYCI